MLDMKFQLMETKGKRSQMCVVAVVVEVLLTSINLILKVHFKLWPTHFDVFVVVVVVVIFTCGYP